MRGFGWVLVCAMPLSAGFGCALIAGLEEPPEGAATTTTTTGPGPGGSGGSGGSGAAGGGGSGAAGGGGSTSSAGGGGMGGGATCPPLMNVVVGALPNTAESAPVAIAVDAEAIYWANEGATTAEAGIRRWDRMSESVTTLAMTDPKTPNAIAVDANYVFWADGQPDPPCPSPDRDRVMRADKATGANPMPLYQSCGRNNELRLFAGKLYFSRATSGQLRFVNVDGSGLGFENMMNDMVNDPFSFAIDATSVYWSDRQPTMNAITAFDRSQKTTAKFADAPPDDAVNESWVAADDTTVYWTTDTEVLKLDKSSPGGMPVVLASVVSARGIALDQDAIYVTDTGAGTVFRVCKAGGPAQVIADMQAEPRGIAVDAAALYWVDRGDGSIMRATW